MITIKPTGISNKVTFQIPRTMKNSCGIWDDRKNNGSCPSLSFNFIQVKLSKAKSPTFRPQLSHLKIKWLIR